MKIAFQIEHLDRHRGGAEMYVDNFARKLLSEGHEVHVITAGAANPPTPVRVYTLPRWSPSAAAEAARQLTRTAGLDVVVGTGPTLGMNVFQPHGGTFLGSRRQNLALIGDPLLRWATGLINRLLPKHRAAARLELQQYAQLDPAPQFVAISRMVRADMQAFYAPPAERLHLVYNGVDTERFHPQRCAELRETQRSAWGLGPQTVCFVLVAHNFRLKGVKELIEAAARVRRHNRDFRVVVVGKGNPGWYRRHAVRMACADCVQLVGPMPDALPAYAAADVYVQPTWYDPCSLVLLEALACGRPVITTAFNGAGELVTPGREGWVIDRPDNTDALADRMVELLDETTRWSMGIAARELAEAHSMDRHFAEMMAVFRVAAGHGDAGTGLAESAGTIGGASSAGLSGATGVRG